MGQHTLNCASGGSSPLDPAIGEVFEPTGVPCMSTEISNSVLSPVVFSLTKKYKARFTEGNILQPAKNIALTISSLGGNFFLINSFR